MLVESQRMHTVGTAQQMGLLHHCVRVRCCGQQQMHTRYPSNGFHSRRCPLLQVPGKQSQHSVVIQTQLLQQICPACGAQTRMERVGTYSMVDHTHTLAATVMLPYIARRAV